MKAGNKEYRIFSNLNIKSENEYENKLEIWTKDKKYIGKRIDFYIFPLILENDINERFGLKFRDILIKNGNFSADILELKKRNDRSSEGIENWRKIISKGFAAFDILTAKNNSDISNNEIIVNINGISYSLNLVKILETIKYILSAYNSNDVLNYLKAFESFRFGFVLTFKNISYKKYGEDVMIKTYYFEMDETKNKKLEAKLCFKRSLCVEKDINENYIEKLNNKLEDYTVAGYPKELLNLDRYLKAILPLRLQK